MTKEKKEKYYKYKNSGKSNSDPIATKNNSKTKEVQGEYPNRTTVILWDSILNGIIHERLI